MFLIKKLFHNFIILSPASLTAPKHPPSPPTLAHPVCPYDIGHIGPGPSRRRGRGRSAGVRSLSQVLVTMLIKQASDPHNTQRILVPNAQRTLLTSLFYVRKYNPDRLQLSDNIKLFLNYLQK